MPWHISKSAKCPPSKPYGVIQDSNGKVVGCHATQASARKQMTDVFERIRQGIIDELNTHRNNIEGGNVNWFSVKIMLNHRSGEIRATWQQEEDCEFRNNGRLTFLDCRTK
jgi:hypothetical protein